MAPKIKVPMDFGVHLRSSPTHNTLKLNTSEGGEVFASSVILSFNSAVIDHMTTTLHMTSVDMLEFSEAAVQVFVDAAYSGTAEGINREIFRDINKMSNVFEVVWLVEKCSEYFNKVTNSIKTPSYSELLYLFEEACFVYENLNKKDYIEVANYKIQELDWKQQFIDKYLENADRLSTKKLDMVIELAGSDVNFVVQTLVNQLTESFEVQRPHLPTFCKYLLDNMDLSLCMKSRGVLFCHLFETLQELPPDKMRWCNRLLLDANKRSIMDSDCSTCTASQKIKSNNSMVRCNTVTNLYHNLDFNLNFGQLLEWISKSVHVTSLLIAIEAICAWNYYHHYVVIGKKTVPTADLVELKQKLDSHLIAKRGWPLLPLEFQSRCLRLYTSKLHCSSPRMLQMGPNWMSPQDSSKFVVLNCIRVVATTPEKTHNQKFLTFETIFNRFFVQF